MLSPMRIDHVASCRLPTRWATFELHGFREPDTGAEHLALVLGDLSDGAPVLCRIHSECLTGDVFCSLRCDCGAQLDAAMCRIAAEGRGILMYERQEGRGIGLMNKIRAYHLQDEGADTVEANEQLGFEADSRNYDACAPLLGHFGVRSVRLLTNNPGKLEWLQRDGIAVAERIPLQAARNVHNERYLQTKARKLGHLLDHSESEPGEPESARTLSLTAAPAVSYNQHVR
jgi:GTP cyclohydrolase II